MSAINTLLGTMRLPFIILTPACILLGVALAVLDQGSVDYFLLALILLAGISAHISVNMFNEYSDFQSGLDFKTQRTPFSGGSGSLPAHPEKTMVKKVLWGAIVSLLITALIGLYFVSIRGWGLLPLGILGVVMILFYTNYITRSPLFCLIAPGLSFGPLMVMGTYYVLTGHYSMTVAVVSLIPFFLVNNLLLLNQYPDIPADKQIGRFHFPIAYGKSNSNKVLFLFYLMAYLVLIIAVVLKLLPVTALAGLLTALVAVKAIQIIQHHFDNVEKILPAMGMNVMVNIFTPVLISVGVIFFA